MNLPGFIGSAGKALIEKAGKCTSIIIVTGLVLLFFVQGYRGRDFGTHWDESQYVNSVIDSVRTGTFLPQMYNYPSFCYWLATTQVVPDVLMTMVDISRLDIKVETPLRKAPAMTVAKDLTEEALILRVRVLCLALTALSLVWTYLLVLVWRQHNGEALLATAFLAGSFELGYHSRWIAPDAILMQLVVLLLLLIFCALRSETRRFGWLVGAAIVFGLAVSTKYTAVFFAVPLFWAGCSPGRQQKARIWPDLFLIGLVALVVFLLVTPGAYLQPVYFFFELMKQKSIYAAGYYGSTVAGGAQHFGLALAYFFWVIFSPYKYVSAITAVFAVTGLLRVCIKDKSRFMLIIAAPVIYFCYFTAQNVMAVRNFLVLLPFFCIFASIGVFFFINIINNNIYKNILLSVVCVFLSVNLWWNHVAAASIQEKNNINLSNEILKYLVDNGTQKFLLSPAVRTVLHGNVLPPNVSAQVENATWFIFINDEYDGLTRMNFLANAPCRYEIVAGAHDVNINYYPAWVGKKVLRISAAEARSMNLF